MTRRLKHVKAMLPEPVYADPYGRVLVSQEADNGWMRDGHRLSRVVRRGDRWLRPVFAFDPRFLNGSRH